MPYADINGARLSYESLGEGVPLLFIHGGYGGVATTLAPQTHAIRNILPRDEFRTILYDRRNAGLSSYGGEHLTMATLAADAHPTQALAEAILEQEPAVEQLAGRAKDDEKVAAEVRALAGAVADEVARNSSAI